VSNVIDFLRQMGEDADLRHAPRKEPEQALADAATDPALRKALLAADQRQLESLLGADTNVFCMVAAPKREEDEEEDEDDLDEDDEDEDEDEDEDWYEMTDRKSSGHRDSRIAGEQAGKELPEGPWSLRSIAIKAKHNVKTRPIPFCRNTG
jgi:hypothetical protein